MGNRNVIWGNLMINILVILFCSTCYPNIFQLDKKIFLPELSCANELQEAINAVIQDNQDYPEIGISAAIIIPGYRTWTGVSGNSTPGVPITNEMLFDAGSIAKNVEAALVLRLVAEKKLSLDDPVSKFLPSYPNVDGKITVRQLLNHTSGVFNVFEHPDFPWVGTSVDYSKNWKIEDVFNTFVLEPYGPPGFAQHYSSTNYLLLTEIIEMITGSSVVDGIERQFLIPMKLEQSFISMDSFPPTQYSVAHPWIDLDQDGNLEDLYGIPLNWKATLTHPVLFSTPNDLVQWMNALYHNRSVLSDYSLEEMLTFPETEIRDPGGGLYGLGIVDYSEHLGVQVIGHGGSSLGYSGAALYLPEYEISMAWLINVGESPQILAEQIMSDIWSSLFDVLRTNMESSS